MENQAIFEMFDSEHFAYYDNMPLDELKKELADVSAAIQNEQIWKNGSTNAINIQLHDENIRCLMEDQKYIEDLIANFV